MKRVKLFNEDNLQALKKLPDNSIDSVVSDPPYGLSFMNKKWDYDVPTVDFWKEVYRVLKPGGHVLSFGGTRTYHRMVVNMEDAGFEIRDQIQWIYGSGFPKSHNIGKAVDKLNGVEREVVGTKMSMAPPEGEKKTKFGFDTNFKPTEIELTKGSSEFEGWGTALKPANEPICLARKPLSEKSVAENVLKWKTGGINVDGCRVGFSENDNYAKMEHTELPEKQSGVMYHNYDEETKPATGHKHKIMVKNDEGRFPANIILECCCDEVIEGEKGEPRYGRKGGTNESEFSKAISPNPEHIGKWFNDKGDIHTNPECPCYIMDQQSGESKSLGGTGKIKLDSDVNLGGGNNYFNYGDKGGASRFFYQAKVSKAERNMGLEPVEVFHQRPRREDGSVIYKEKNPQEWIEAMAKLPRKDKTSKAAAEEKLQTQSTSVKNTHPTVKPINLLTYLCRLVTPPNGIVLDPFMGSGSTGIAAQLEGFRFCGMELDKDYFKIAEARIENFQKYEKFIKKV